MNLLPSIAKQDEISKQSTSELLHKPYDYFSTKIPRSHIEMVLKVVKDERFLFFLKYGQLRRYDGDCEVIYVEIPQIPRKLVIYRRPSVRMKCPEKLNLSSRDLPHIPLFEGEENLKVLSLEMNQIAKIDQLISLSNLSYLNLYCNKIKEIENLHTTSRLRVLLLGKNLIEKIRNVSMLVDLEILDLHSNKIKLIENISQLERLRILNIANNQISSLSELTVNKSLEELNARKNLIGSLPSLANCWEKMKKINLGKNLISKLETLSELKQLKSLLEVSLEDNPVVLLKETSEILRTIPKVNVNFSNRSVFLISGNSNSGLNASIQQQHTRSSSPLTAIPANHRINHTNSLTCIGSSGRNSLLKAKNQFSQLNTSQTIFQTIQSKWAYEYSQVIKMGFNGYNKQKMKEEKAILGQIEHGTDKSEITCYGDVLNILFNDEYQHITSIHFKFFFYDTIMTRKNIERMGLLKELHTLSFSENNLHSLYQLTKLERIDSLEHICIRSNEICSCGLLKYFMIYRLQNLKSFNGEEVKDEDVKLARGLFEVFNKSISDSDLKSNKAAKKEKDAKPEASNTSSPQESGKLHNEDKASETNGQSDLSKEVIAQDKQLGLKDGTGIKILSFIKGNLDLIIKEILFDFANNE